MPKSHERRALAVVLATLFLDVIGFGLIIPVMPDLIVELVHVPVSEAAGYSGWLMGIFAIMQFVFGPVIGGLGDRFGRRPVILTSLLAFGLDYFVMGFAPTYALLFVSRAVAGIAGASFVPASAYMADITPPERRAQNFGLIGAAFGMGFVIGPALGGFLGSFGVRVPFFVAGALALINAVSGWFFLPESLPADRRRPFDIRRANPFGTFSALARHREALVLFVAWFLWIVAHQSYPSTWAFYTKIKFGWGESAVGASLSYAGLTLALAQAFVTRRLIPRIGERRSILLGLTAGFIGFVGVAVVPQAWMLYVVMTFSAFQGLVFPSMNSTLTRIVSPSEQGELQGGVASMQSLAAVIGPPTMTHVLAHFSRDGAPVRLPGAPYLLAAGITAAAFVLVATFARKVFALSRAAMAPPAAAAAAPAPDTTL